MRNDYSEIKTTENIVNFIVLVRHVEDNSLGIISSDVSFVDYQPRFECTYDITAAHRFQLPESQVGQLLNLINLDYTNYKVTVVKL